MQTNIEIEINILVFDSNKDLLYMLSRFKCIVSR